LQIYNSGRSDRTKFPHYNDVRLESISILYNEICKFRYHHKMGIALEFTTVKRQEASLEGYEMNIAVTEAPFSVYHCASNNSDIVQDNLHMNYHQS